MESASQGHVAAAAAYVREHVRWRASSVAVAGSLALGLGFRLGALRLPFDRDEGAYGTIGRGMLDGLVPYRDLFDHKPPVIYGFYALATSLGGDELLAVRGLSALLFAAALLLVFAIAREVYSERAAAMAALAFALVGNDFGVEAARANTEQVMLPALLASVWLALRAGQGGSRVWWLLVCGVAGGIGVLTKPVGVLALAVVVGYVTWSSCTKTTRAEGPRYRRTPGALHDVLVVIVGACLPIAITIAYFAANGALGDFCGSVVTFNSEYVRYFWDHGAGGDVLDVTPVVGVYGGLALAGVAAGFTLPRERWAGHAFVVAWTTANLVGAKMGLRPFGHYFVPVLPGIALLSAACVEAIVVAASRIDMKPWMRYAPAAAVVVVAAGWQARENAQFYWLDSPETQVRREFGTQGTMLFSEADGVAAYVRSVTTPSDEILVLGMEPEVYYLADRTPAARFVYALPLAFSLETVEGVRAGFASGQQRVIVTQRGDTTISPAMLSRAGYVRTYRTGLFEVYEPGYAVQQRSEVAGIATEGE
jgi:4-amino-4-deoxy-L-arabinose transferase-like glycosyltransferase